MMYSRTTPLSSRPSVRYLNLTNTNSAHLYFSSRQRGLNSMPWLPSINCRTCSIFSTRVSSISSRMAPMIDTTTQFLQAHLVLEIAHLSRLILHWKRLPLDFWPRRYLYLLFLEAVPEWRNGSATDL